MVYNKIVVLLSFINILLISFKCDGNKRIDNEGQVSQIGECLEELKSDIYSDTILFCSNEIINKNVNNIYYHFKDLDCLELYLKEEVALKYSREINDFISYSTECSAYICKDKEKKYLIIIGKAIGASGIGHLYWNFIYTDLKEDIQYRSSLVNTPFSFQLKENQVHFVEINDNFSLEEYEKEDTLNLSILKYIDNKVENKENFMCKISRLDK